MKMCLCILKVKNQERLKIIIKYLAETINLIYNFMHSNMSCAKYFMAIKDE